MIPRGTKIQANHSKAWREPSKLSHLVWNTSLNFLQLLACSTMDWIAFSEAEFFP